MRNIKEIVNTMKDIFNAKANEIRAEAGVEEMENASYQRKMAENKRAFGDWWQPGMQPSSGQPQQRPQQSQQPQQPQQQVPQSALRMAPQMNEDTMRQMVGIYGGEDAPLMEYTPQMVEATQYDFWKNNPELLALIPHLETSSGRNITRPNNLINYGIRDPKINELFRQVGVSEAFRRSLKEIGETGNVYKKFRTGSPLTDDELLEFANTYEPMNKSYGPNLLEGREFIREKLGL